MRQKYLKILCSIAAIMVMVLLLFVFSPMGLVRANPGPQIIATGLNNPRGIESGPGGVLYIAEAGLGGPPESMGGTCGFNPGGEGDRCYGETGGVSRVNIDGSNQQRIISDMVSLANPMNFGVGPAAATGPQDVAFDAGGNMYVTVGWGGDPVSRTAIFGPDGANFGQLTLVTEVMTGVYGWANVVDIAQYEADNNPDGGPVDSNPFGLATDPDGFAIADAGANALFLVDPDTPAVSTLAVFPTRTAEITDTGIFIPMQAVPTDVVLDADNSYIVGQLTGFPFPEDGGWVFNVPDGGGMATPREISFTHPIDVERDGLGNLYVLEMDSDGLFLGPGLTGSVIQIETDGTRTVLDSSLGLPVGMTMGADGALYITACMQTVPLPEPCLPGQGVVVRIDPAIPTDVNLSGLSGDVQGTSTPLVLLLTLIVLIPAVALVLRRRNAIS